LDLIFFEIALALYLAASVAYPLFLVFSTRIGAGFALALLVGGFGCHTLSIMHRTIFSRFFPLATTFDALSFFAWLIIGLFFIIRRRVPGPIFGAIAAPFGAVLMIIGMSFSYQLRLPIIPILHSWWLPIHVILALLGNGVFALMAIGGLMYIVQEKLIKKKRIGRMYKLLPSLETLDEINRRGLPIGFFFLTLGIISGALWSGTAWGFYWSWDPKETWSLITWFVYAAMIHQRVVLGRRGRRAAMPAILGFGLVMFTFLGVSLLFGGHHAFGLFSPGVK
jgi:cytochrome c-type biogenesis protein CcsB